jgi:NAD(P)-dependent dehydrogenase (short-subunit alcohol dehydrogenase family)
LLESASGPKLPAMSIAVVTGANRGIGLALVLALRQRGEQVVAACRSKSPELVASGAEVVDHVDVSSAAGVARLAEVVGQEPVSLLINNAGILVWGDELAAPKWEEIIRQFEVNALGALRVTHALLARFDQGAKIAFITSRMGSIGDNGSGGHYGYRMSKAAMNIAAG